MRASIRAVFVTVAFTLFAGLAVANDGRDRHRVGYPNKALEGGTRVRSAKRRLPLNIELDRKAPPIGLVEAHLILSGRYRRGVPLVVGS